MTAELFACKDYLNLTIMNEFSSSLPLCIILYVITCAVLLVCLQCSLGYVYAKRKFMALADLVIAENFAAV